MAKNNKPTQPHDKIVDHITIVFISLVVGSAMLIIAFALLMTWQLLTCSGCS